MVDGSVFDLPSGETPSVPERFRATVSRAALASHPEAFDPMDLAIHTLSKQAPVETQPSGWKLVRRYPLSKELLAISHVWQLEDGSLRVASKGAPEAISDLCRLPDAGRRQLLEAAHAMARDGLRVLGVAEGLAGPGPLPDRQDRFSFSFLGLIGLSDPIRPAVPAAIRECRGAGIRVVMITGDYPETARQIARQIGLEPLDQVVTGREMEALDDAGLREKAQQVSLFARIVPEQKLRLVNALKSDGEIVAMTGDGVNDAPALKAAHIGIAMGERGTDVAREAASLVLLNDDFSSIVRAVRLGRRVFDNLRRAMSYLFAIHVPIAGMALIPVLLKGPLVLLPVHIVFLEIIIDPACSIVFEAEPEDPAVMSRPPRNPKEPLFNRQRVAASLLQGMAALGIALGVYLTAWTLGRPEWEIRSATFAAMLLSNLGLILVNRSRAGNPLAALSSPNPALWWVIGSALAVLGLVLTVPFLREVFRFT